MSDPYSTGPDTALDERTEEQTETPRMYRVLLHNDHYTTMDFVVEILRTVFRKTADEAVRIMLDVHHNEVGVCGSFPREIAETKLSKVHELANQHEYPLKATMEED